MSLKEDLAKLARERQAHGQTAPGKTLTQNSAEPMDRGETRDALADMAGVSHDTIAKVERIERDAIPEARKRQQETFGMDAPTLCAPFPMPPPWPDPPFSY